LFSLLFFSRARESSSAIRGAQQQQHGTANPLAVRCISHPMNRFVLTPSTGETLHCVVAQLPAALIVNGNDSAAMTADRKEESKKKEEEKRPQRKCDKSRAPVKFVNWLLSRQQPFLFFSFCCVGALAAAHYYII
jgi:hypothetical protein